MTSTGVCAICASCAAGAARRYEQLFVDLLANKALRFFASYPTGNDARDAGEEVVAQVGRAVASRRACVLRP
jgi:hypothetical protein